MFFSIWLSTAQGATPDDTGVYVEIKDRETPDARVIERWRLYGNSHALVVGIDDYTNGWPRLSNAIADAERVAKALESRGFDVTLLKNVTSSELRRELRRFFTLKGADPDTRLFVWFSGHGYSEFGEGYLVPADAPVPEKPEFLISALHMRDFGGLVRLAKAKHAMAVFDSCFAGTIFSVQRSRPPAAITRATVKPVRQFITSGDADQKVADDGTFSQLVIDALEGQARADANDDGYLTGSELSLHLEQRVTNLTEGLQTPRSGKLRDPRFDGGDFVFLLPRRKAETQVAAAVLPSGSATTATRSPDSAAAPSLKSGPDDATFDLEFWNAIKKSTNAADFLAYLESFPSGRFAPLARVRVNALKPAEIEPEPEPAETTDPAVEPSDSQPAKSQVAAVERELVAWNTVRGSRSPEDLEAFLRQFPDGDFSELARFRLEQLAPKQTALVITPEPRLRRIDQVFLAVRNANVRSLPDGESAKLGFLKKGAEVYVHGRVEGQRWLAVELDGGASGFVYAPLLAPAGSAEPAQTARSAPTAAAPQPAVPAQVENQQAMVPVPKEIRLEPIEELFTAVKNASVRAQPDVGSKQVESLKKGTTVHVAGKVKGQNWLSVDRNGEHLGYVYAPLLGPVGRADVGGTVAPAKGKTGQSPGQGTRSAALSSPANPFDGTWQGQGQGHSDTCGGDYRISLVTRNQTVTGTFEESGRTASISGRLDRRGRLEGVSATVKRIRIEFSGGISGDRLIGRWKGEKRKHFGEINCAGRLDLARQAVAAGSLSAGQAGVSSQSSSQSSTQSVAATTNSRDGTWGGTGQGRSDTCQGSFQIRLVTRGAAVKGAITYGGRSASISGELDDRGRLERTYATVKGIQVEFTGSVSGDRLNGTWSGEKRKNFGEIACKGTMVLARQAQSGASN